MSDLRPIQTYFEERIQEHGASPRGVDWNSSTAQEARFGQLLRIVRQPGPFTLLDYGSGYGALAEYLERERYDADYIGYDMLESAIALAEEHHRGKPRRKFFSELSSLPTVDYAVASGVFNYRGPNDFESWTKVVVDALSQMDRLSSRGFASTFLTKYSDADRMLDHLYYADPLFLFDYCKRHFSKNVALLHDYTLYDFTILVRKDG